MNTLEIGKKLKKLVFKRPKGGGEYSYVHVATGKEVEGNSEVLQLLKDDLENWEEVESLKLGSESSEAFEKKIKKQIKVVLFEEQYKDLVGKSSEVKVKKRLIVDANVDASPAKSIKKVENDSENNTPSAKEENDTPAAQEENEVMDVEEDEVKDVKPVNLRTFTLAEIPSEAAGTVKVEDEENNVVDNGVENGKHEGAVEVIKTKDLIVSTEDQKYVLVFSVKKQIDPKEVRRFFLEKFSGALEVKKTLNSNGAFKGVYVIYFSTEDSARECVSEELILNELKLDKVTLRDYKKENFFLRSVQKARAFKANQGYLEAELEAEKKDNKLDNCVVIQVKAEEDEVQEHFCGLESSFVENFEEYPVEEVKTIPSPKVPQYVIVFESNEGARKFYESPEFHKVGDIEAKVILLTERKKRVRYGEKIKNFSDDKEFSDADNTRRIVVTGVKGEATPSEVESGVREIFPNIVHLHRCQIDEFFWGLYVLSFSTPEEANDALNHNLVENDVFRQPNLTMLLSEYLEQRDIFLNRKNIIRRNKSSGGEDKSWVTKFEVIENRYKEEYPEIYKAEMESKKFSFDQQDEDDGSYNPMNMLRSKR